MDYCDRPGYISGFAVEHYYIDSLDVRCRSRWPSEVATDCLIGAKSMETMNWCG